MLIMLMLIMPMLVMLIAHHADARDELGAHGHAGGHVHGHVGMEMKSLSVVAHGFKHFQIIVFR